jgi:hypothetical protein
VEYIYSVRTGGFRGRGVYVLRPDWWLERPLSIYTPSGLVALEAPEYIYSARTESVKGYFIKLTTQLQSVKLLAPKFGI